MPNAFRFFASPLSFMALCQIEAKAREVRLPRLITTAPAACRSTGMSVRFGRLDMTRVHARDAHSRLAGRFVLLATSPYFSRQIVTILFTLMRHLSPHTRHRQHPVLHRPAIFGTPVTPAADPGTDGGLPPCPAVAPASPLRSTLGRLMSLYDGIGWLIKPCLKIECATAWIVVGFLAICSVETLMTTGINTGSVLRILMPELKSPRTTRRGAFAYKAVTGHTGIVDPS